MLPTDMISNILTRIFGSRNERLLKQYGGGGPRRSTRSSRRSSALADEALTAKTAEFKERVANGEDARRSSCPRRSPSFARPASARCRCATSTSS